eukprot:49968-Pleurochrysis_carterae.AAC.2
MDVLFRAAVHARCSVAPAAERCRSTSQGLNVDEIDAADRHTWRHVRGDAIMVRLAVRAVSLGAGAVAAVLAASHPCE